MWDPPPVTPWEFEQSLNIVEDGLLPSLKPLNPFKDVLVEVELNKSSNVNIIPVSYTHLTLPTKA